MKSNESKLQAECVQWFRFNYPSYRYLLFAIPNGGLRNVKTAARLKKEGVVAGVPDLFFAFSTNESAGLFIEMKYGKNKMTEAQKYMRQQLINQNYTHELCYSFDEFVQIIKNYLHERN